MLLQDDQPLHEAQQSPTTVLMYNIPLVTDTIHQNTFKCEAKLTGRTDPSDTAFNMVTVYIESKSMIVLWIYII